MSTGRPTRLLLIRHARVESGTPARLYGCLDLPLSPAGREQLAALSREVRHLDRPAALYTSPLSRARETAAALGHAWGMEPCVRDDLREIDCGRLEGTPIERLEREHADLWARNTAQADDDFTWPEGESYRQFRRRVLEALARIAAAHPGDRVAAVTHTGVVTQVIGALRNRPAAVWDADRPDPLTVTEVEWEDGAPRRVLRFNERAWR